MTAHGNRQLHAPRTVALGMLALWAGVIVAATGDGPVPPEPRGTPGLPAKLVFACDFTESLAKEWQMAGGKWGQTNGCLKMTDPGSSDPTKAILLVGESDSVSFDVVVTAKLRLDAWSEDNGGRAGVGVCADPATGHGLNLVFYRGRLAFVHDHVEWGPSCDFRCKVGEWYWIKLHKTEMGMEGKAWRDEQPEPTDWMVTWTQDKAGVTGYPALVGCSASSERRISAVSFARCEVRLGDGPFGYYTRGTAWFETMAASRVALARQEVEIAARAKQPPSSSKARREGLWALLQRDFQDGDSLRQMAAERQDNIWTEDWSFDRPNVLAERYANATRAGLAERARELAERTKALPDIQPVRELYYRSREIEQVLAGWDANIESLRLAVEDLTGTYAGKYPKGQEYLREISGLRSTVADAQRTPGRAGDIDRLDAAMRRFKSLRQEALFANPLLDFDRLLLVKRKDSRSFHPLPAFEVQGIGSGPENHLNGLPVNFQGNGVLRQVPIENEIALLSPFRPGASLTTVFRPAKPAYVGDLKLHFDADRLLFSSIGSHERFQIFEIGADGKGLRQVTRGDEDDVDNYDSCYLPDDRILFGSSACFQSVPCQRRFDEVANLFVMNPDGGGVRRLCFDQDHNFYPTMMSDGRVLYLRWEYTDIAHAFSARLFTMNPDGTAQRAYYGSSSYWPNRIFYAKPIPGQPTKFAGIVTGHHGTARAGELILFDVSRGRRHADGALQRIPGRGKKVEAILRDGLVDGSWPKFLHPYPLSDKYFLVACQPTRQSWWGIYLVDAFDNLLLVREEEGWMLVEPVALRPTARPPVIPDRIVPQSKEATVYLTDIYAGEGLKGIPPGTVKELRLFTYHFNYLGTSGIEDYIGMDGPWDVRRVLGTVPVARDGSAYFIVPANTPIALQPLDAEGKALQLMRSWFTAMPGEAVSCVGCHEEINDAPPNHAICALAGKPSPIKPWHGPVRGFSWDREVQPVLDRYCIECHDGGLPADGKTTPDLRRAEPRTLPLSDAPFPPSFYALRRFVRSPGLEGDPRVLPPADYHADTNPLTRMLRQGHHKVQLDNEAWDRLVTWMDMNAPAYGTWLEIPTARGNPTARQSSNRRCVLLKRYAGVDDNPEADAALEPAVLAAATAPTAPASAVPERQHPSVVDRPSLPGWPFSAEEAKRRQGGAAEIEVALSSGVTLRLVLIPAGEFVMGDPAGCDNTRPLGRVQIERPFWMGKVEVTREQFRCFDSSHRNGVEPMLWLKWSWEDYADLDQPRQPVCRVSWDEAVAFCRWLSSKTGKAFSLASEAQWEWACRAGTDTALSFGPVGSDSSAFANLADASLLGITEWGRTAVGFSRTERVRQFYAVDPVADGQRVSADVGSFQPNRWGLQDAHGNVAEWTASAALPYPFRADDPRHAQPGVRRVVRGGSWFDRADLARSASRASYWPWQRVFDVGFRVICEAERTGPLSRGQHGPGGGKTD